MASHAHLDLAADPVHRPRVIRMPRLRTSPQLPGTMTASPERMKLSGPASARDRVNARRTALGIGPPDAPWSRCWRRPGVVDHEDVWEPEAAVPGVAAPTVIIRKCLDPGEVGRRSALRALVRAPLG